RTRAAHGAAHGGRAIQYLTASINWLTMRLPPARQVTDDQPAIRGAHRRGAALLALLHTPARPVAGKPGAHALLPDRGARPLRAGTSRAGHRQRARGGSRSRRR